MSDIIQKSLQQARSHTGVDARGDDEVFHNFDDAPKDGSIIIGMYGTTEFKLHWSEENQYWMYNGGQVNNFPTSWKRR